MKSILKISKYSIPVQEDNSLYKVHKWWYIFSYLDWFYSSEKIYSHGLTSEESLNNRIDNKFTI